MSDAPTELSNYQASAETVQHYLDGARFGRGSNMKQAFHDDAIIFGHAGASMLAGPIQRLFDGVDQNPGVTELQARIATIDLIDTIATVRLELDNWYGKRYTDMFTLLKAEGEWKIVNKVFHLHP